MVKLKSAAEGDEQGEDANVAAQEEGETLSTKDSSTTTTPGTAAGATDTSATSAGVIDTSAGAIDKSAGAGGNGVSFSPNKTEQERMPPPVELAADDVPEAGVVGPVAGDRSEAGGADGGQSAVKGGAVGGSHAPSPTR